MRTASVKVTVGPMLSARALAVSADSDRKLMMDAVGLAIAGLLPASYRGVYGDGSAHAEARAVLEVARSGATAAGSGP